LKKKIYGKEEREWNDRARRTEHPNPSTQFAMQKEKGKDVKGYCLWGHRWIGPAGKLIRQNCKEKKTNWLSLLAALDQNMGDIRPESRMWYWNGKNGIEGIFVRKR
jgi:hypothetical protein